MYSVSEIIKKERETYYDFNSGKSKPFYSILFFEFLVAIFIAFLFFDISEKFLSSIISIYAILIGFAFSVLFYMISQNPLSSKEEDQSFEQEARVEKLTVLSKEIFYNVSYFSIFSLMVLVLGMVLIIRYNATQFELGDWFSSFASAIAILNLVFKSLVIVTLYATLLESTRSFFRTLRRVTYYFEKRVQHDL